VWGLYALRQTDNEDAPDEQVAARLISERFSCRRFLPEPVPHQTIERLLSLAQMTASCCNSQPWQVLVTEGEATERFRSAIYEYASQPGVKLDTDIDHKHDYPGVYKERRRDCGIQLYESIGIPRHDREAGERQRLENFRFFGAPHVALVTSEAALGTLGAIDCGAWLSNFLVAATSLGVAAVPQASLSMYAKFTRAFFGIPDNRWLLFGISFGYADHEHPANQFRSRRAPLSEVATFVSE